MSHHETDDITMKTAEKFQEWRTRPASVTNGHLLASRALWTFFLALSAFVGYRQLKLDNELTRDRIDYAFERAAAQCEAVNERREEARVIALGDVTADQSALDSDAASWRAIDDLFGDGIPEPARTTVFSGLISRQSAIDTQRELIELTYQHVPCPAGEIATDDLSVVD